MKSYITAIVLFSTFFISGVSAQTDAEMKAWQNYMTPGDAHKMLARADGIWTEEITMWMDPAAAPEKYTATSKNEMVLGGRYQLSKINGTMMGMPFEAISLLGYDNSTKLFTSTWIDNFGTGTLTMVGPWDEATKSITLKGKMIDPMTGKEIWSKQVMKFIDDNTQEIEMYDNKNGTETKNMVIKSIRKK